MNIDIAIEKCRPSTGEHAFEFVDEWARYELIALSEMNRLGIKDTDNVLVETMGKTDCDRFVVWLWDSVAWTIGRVRRVEKDPTDVMSLREAFRGMLQIRGYQGRLCAWGLGYLGDDTSHAIQNWLQDRIAKL
jgi:hypothetical protein